MIYRLERPYGQDGVSYSYDLKAGPYWFPGTRIPTPEYEDHFEEIKLSGDWPLSRVFKAPILPEWRLNINTVIDVSEIDKKSLKLQDIMASGKIYVSEKAKSVIQSIDPFGHQFWPVELVDEQGQRLNEEPYYLMNMRRYVMIEPNGKPLQRLDFSPATGEMEADVLPTIQHQLEVRKNIETLPMWRYITPLKQIAIHVLYFNEVLMDAFKKAGVTGIEEYTEYAGKDGEVVGHV
ncbi:imm11 family protein [Litoribacillus peritrichatus]|uniref:Immunity MXAN-0049 protein domain-containing protein n=1 Tax=Litoribacillus peritrichatus TaxID=718191 RepID=A0ABP7MET1_9GAMM